MDEFVTKMRPTAEKFLILRNIYSLSTHRGVEFAIIKKNERGRRSVMRHEIDINEFDPIIREFAGYKSYIQGCSQRTVEQYLIDLRTFFRYLLCEGQHPLR